MTDVKTLLTGPLRRAGIPDAEIIATEQLALLRGHHLLAEPGTPTRRTKPAAPIQYCGDGHPGTKLESGRCPTCGWTPSPANDH